MQIHIFPSTEQVPAETRKKNRISLPRADFSPRSFDYSDAINTEQPGKKTLREFSTANARRL